MGGDDEGAVYIGGEGGPMNPGELLSSLFLRGGLREERGTRYALEGGHGETDGQGEILVPHEG